MRENLARPAAPPAPRPSPGQEVLVAACTSERVCRRNRKKGRCWSLYMRPINAVAVAWVLAECGHPCETKLSAHPIAEPGEG